MSRLFKEITGMEGTPRPVPGEGSLAVLRQGISRDEKRVRAASERQRLVLEDLQRKIAELGIDVATLGSVPQYVEAHGRRHEVLRVLNDGALLELQDVAGNDPFPCSPRLDGLKKWVEKIPKDDVSGSEEK